jgi:SMI1 / KNR4 family (SUKH-1)
MADERLSPQLIERIRERASDPARRSDANSMRSQTVGLDAVFDSLGPKREQMRSIMNQIQDLMGPSGPRLGDPAPRPSEPLARTASTEQLAECEKAIGRSLPPALRQLYTEVANGGFGPGAGLFGLERIAEAYREMTAEPAGPQNQAWPSNLLPLVDAEPGYDCLDMDGGEMIGWDPGQVEGYSNAAWRRSFKRLAPSLGAWLEAWLDRPALGDWMAAVREQDRRNAKARALQSILDYYEKNPAQRAEDGLPEVGWEDEVRRRHPGLEH